jgi:integrase
MARPTLPLGTWGKVRTQKARGGYRAIANYRDFDGVTRPVERNGTSASRARTRLLEAMRDRERISRDNAISADTKVDIVAEIYFAELGRSEKAIRTKQSYRYAWTAYLSKPLSNLRVFEMKVSIVNKVLTTIRDKRGSGAAKQARGVLSGICALMVRHDALDDNPVREIESLSKKKDRSGTRPGGIHPGNAGRMLAHFHGSEDAAKWDLVDMQDAFSGLGCRTGEMLALDWETSIDFDKGTIYFHGTVIRVKGVGLIVQPYTKTPAGMRRIRPPSWVMAVLKRRYATATSPWVFPSTKGTLRDPDNTRDDMRAVLAGTEFEGLTPKDWRHYVATVLDAMGLTARQIADYLGHDKPSTTQDVYMDRGIVGEEASAALETRPAPWAQKHG